MITDDELKAARALCDAAVEGPWDRLEGDESNIVDANGMHVCRTMEPSKGDPDHEAAFIAASRTLVPRLLDEVERLKTERCYGCDANIRESATARAALADVLAALEVSTASAGIERVHTLREKASAADAYARAMSMGSGS